MMPEMSLFQRMLHWGPLLATFIIACTTLSTLYCHLQWWPLDDPLGLIDVTLFLIFSSQCFANLLRAAHLGPGYVPLRWQPENLADQQKLQYCATCQGYKAPRSHHCRKCNRCVMKMDHHCPWINNCCGHFNQAFFVKFLFFAVIGSLHATLILGPSIYRAIFRVWYIYYGTGDEPIVELGLIGIFLAIFSFGLAFGVILAVGFLLIMQIRSILRNKSGIEDYIVSKALHRPRDDKFVYPYDLGWKKNFKLVFFKDAASLDGFCWPIVDGCDQFTFTVEQLLQKEAKRQLLVEYLAVENYDGSLFCSWVRFGCLTFLCQPLTDEMRLILNPGNRVLVSRWRRFWLYGQLICENHSSADDLSEVAKNVVSEDILLKQRGWFPRRCVVEQEDSVSDASNDMTRSSQN